MQQQFNEVKLYFQDLQTKICHELAAEDEINLFATDNWESALGCGATRLLQNGAVFEKAGVNFSDVSGSNLPQAALANRTEYNGLPFQATGISLVIHPYNPFVPTAHANLRFMLLERDGEQYWWFGGGYDLTPYYGFVEDCQHWHAVAKAACDPFGVDIYPKFKRACDDYFYIPHRAEPRGIGGLFFDDFNEVNFENSFNLIKSIGDSFLRAYIPIVKKRKHLAFNEKNKHFQLLRRGRYVEFNLIYDRGTHFGLQSGGRVESILMSLPKHVSWEYDWKPEINSEEEKLYKHFLIAKNWVD